MADEPTKDVTEEVIDDAQVMPDPSQTPEPVVETPAEQVEEPEVTPEEPIVEEAIPEEQPPSRRETLRIQTLLKKYGNPQTTSQAPSQVKQDGLDYQTALDADPEVIRQLEADRQANGQVQYNAGLQQAQILTQNSQWRTLLEIDAPRVEEQYPWLNPKDTQNFDPAIADAMNSEYKHFIGYDERTGMARNPARYSEFVDAKVELATRLAETMSANTTKNVARQAATTGIRPDGSSAKRLNLNQAPENMSIEELYAKIGQAPPKKQ